MKIPDIQKRANATEKVKGFLDSEKSIPEDIALMHAELSEALEEYRKGVSTTAMISTSLSVIVIEITDIY